MKARDLLPLLRKRREELDMAQADIGRAMSRTAQSVSLIENEQRGLRLDDAVDYAQALGLELRVELVDPATDTKLTPLLAAARKLGERHIALLLRIAEGLGNIPADEDLDRLAPLINAARSLTAERFGFLVRIAENIGDILKTQDAEYLAGGAELDGARGRLERERRARDEG